MSQISLDSVALLALAKVLNGINTEAAARHLNSTDELAAFTRALHAVDRSASDEIHASRSSRRHPLRVALDAAAIATGELAARQAHRVHNHGIDPSCKERMVSRGATTIGKRGACLNDDGTPA